MKTQSSNVAAPIGKLAKALVPMALMGQAIQLDTQANVQEVASLIEEAIASNKQESEVHNQIQTQLEEALAKNKGAASNLVQVETEAKASTEKHKHEKKKEKDAHKKLNEAPENKVLSKAAQDIVGPNEFIVHAPIDEVNPLTVKLAPTFERDTVMSARVGAFRKIVGYDTFESILKEERDEIKDTNDYYNVSINLMIKRTPLEGPGKVLDEWNGGVALSPKLDKGFPYDDGDNTISDKVKGPQKSSYVGKPAGKLNGENITTADLKNLITDKAVPLTESTFVLIKGDGDNVFKLMDENVTKGQMKNLLTDKPAPITVKLAQTSGDADNVFKLMDENVTKGQMKNLLTDKPAPITVKLAQISGDGDNVFKLMDENVTKGQMKNLITDKPAPITVKLAQTSGDADNVFKLMDENVTKGQMKNLITDKPAPITVKLAQISGDGDNVFKLMDENVTKGQMKNLITDKPAPITVKLAQLSNPVVNPPFNNWSVNQPTVPHESGDAGAQDLELRNLIIEGVNGYDFVQTNAQNPVVNPPFNNWSVNQPTVPHDSGLAGDADLGQHIIVDGHAIQYSKQQRPVQFAQIIPANMVLTQVQDVQNAPGIFLIKDQDHPDSLE